ncbi:MAG: toll/interleukin-1 receptor domain-containing protein [Roseomonas sp.]|jgi:hypothetical protein|nr:toll/interleukin-1 receptor domain-containing protein [Roseomonas sp.]MCA3291692.1 toll/interleukin-1 receptor domain-containing protein [Roseomonas sp.]MCA3294468.1 toll/interleukin-1 receptor domain-containing protein [Roseomonas sp.]
MKLFISWSGERSEALAKALREWLPLVLHFVEPWLSQSDIQPGERWSVQIAKELEHSKFGIICVTRENLNTPWILFEAGALAKSMEDGRVIPLLLDLDFKEISGPLAQFQAKKIDEIGIKELVTSFNKAFANPVADGQIDKLFSALWSDLQKQIGAIPKGAAPTRQHRQQGEILEELVSSVRNVEMRVRDAMDGDTPVRTRRHPQVRPDFMHKGLSLMVDGPGDPIIILFVASLVRDEMPWFYELAVDTYRALSGPRPSNGRNAFRRFQKAWEFLERAGPSENIYNWKMVHMLMREFFNFYEIVGFKENDDGSGGSLSRS